MSDGGNVEFVEIDGPVVYLRLQVCSLPLVSFYMCIIGHRIGCHHTCRCGTLALAVRAADGAVCLRHVDQQR